MTDRIQREGPEADPAREHAAVGDRGKGMRIAVIGAGSFGTALAMLLAGKGYDVCLYGRNAAQLAAMRDTRENARYLPGVQLPSSLELTDALAEALRDAETVVYAVPAQQFRSVLSASAPALARDAVLINAAKGIERDTGLLLSQVASEVLPGARYGVLTGPSHAEEVARGLPTTVTAAASDPQLAAEIQALFHTDRFRVYRHTDLTGAELGGALKNIIALGAGISDGLGFGDNAKAALMTRGIAEITRLGLAMGAEADTFAGLAGIGDLIVTCTSRHSRNLRCGRLIGQGVPVEEARAQVGMAVEGLDTTPAAYRLADRYGIEMPITSCMYAIISGRMQAREAAASLMGRDSRAERDARDR